MSPFFVAYSHIKIAQTESNMQETIQIGKLLKAHSIHGATKALFTYLQKEGKQPPHLFISKNGDQAPYFVAQWNALDATHAIISFEECTDRSAAEAITPAGLFIAAKDIDTYFEKPQESSNKKLVGYSLLDQSKQSIGPITAIDEDGLQVLLEVSYNNQHKLIPLVEELIIEINDQAKTLQLELAEGLLEL